MIKTFSLLDLWGRLSPPVHKLPQRSYQTEVISKQKTFSGKALNRGHIKTKNLLREGTEPGEGLWKEMENDVQATP